MATKVSYVRFLRGTPTAFANLSVKDPDTLYFISLPDAKKGDLYLGDKLIAGGDTVDISLSQLKDVVINGAAEPDAVLAYDFKTGTWVNKSASEIYNEIAAVMTGATADEDGKSGLVPQAKAGQQNSLLQGGGTWVNPSDITVDGTTLGTLKANVTTLIGDDSGQSIRQIAVAVLKEKLIAPNAKEELDSLEEIAAWIQSHPEASDIGNFNDRVKALENTVNGVFDDSGQETTPGLVTKVGNLTQSFNTLNQTVFDLGQEVSDHTTSIRELYDKLRWHELDEEIANQEGN